MCTDNLSFRWAKIEDAPFVTWGVFCALHTTGSPAMVDYVAKHICSREADILYSYRNALLAIDGDKPVGLCLCYNGEGYHERRLTTFKLFEQAHNAINEKEEQDMDFEHAEDETEAGEYYIDSLAVLPEYRGHGIAKQLLKAQIEHAKLQGFDKATLLVDPDNPPALHLYESLGFRYYKDCYAFGMIFAKMALPL